MKRLADEVSTHESYARERILDLLRARNGSARFVTELYAALARLQVSAGAAGQALAELEKTGLVMVRDHFCADPHLGGVDLRIAALVQSRDDADPQMSTIRVIDDAWNKWLTEYLANHRCG